jgi:SAM-dependent methyltransferase
VACDLAFRLPILASTAYDSLYREVDPATWAGGPGREDWALVERYLASNVPAGASVLDFGCHTGGLLKQLGPRYARTGIEINEQAARVARDQAGAEIVRDLESLPGGKRFDVVTAVDVLEPFADPGRVIASLLEVVKPGGALVITTGDADAWLWRITGARWWYCYYPEHLAFISERWVRDWLRRTGSDARIVDGRIFRYLLLSPSRYALQSCLLAAYVVSPGGYTRVAEGLQRLLGRKDTAYPPGVGLTRDHVFLALRKVA